MKSNNTHCPQNSAKTVLGKEWDPSTEFLWELHRKGSRETEGTRMLRVLSAARKRGFPWDSGVYSISDNAKAAESAHRRGIHRREFSPCLGEYWVTSQRLTNIYG